MSGATSDDGELVRQLFSSVGICERVPESQQDAFTGMAGSGPAYIYTVIEALSDGGVRMGLPRQLSARLAAQVLALWVRRQSVKISLPKKLIQKSTSQLILSF